MQKLAYIAEPAKFQLAFASTASPSRTISKNHVDAITMQGKSSPCQESECNGETNERRRKGFEFRDTTPMFRISSRVVLPNPAWMITSTGDAVFSPWSGCRDRSWHKGFKTWGHTLAGCHMHVPNSLLQT